jgi:hypothetical protein
MGVDSLMAGPILNSSIRPTWVGQFGRWVIERIKMIVGDSEILGPWPEVIQSNKNIIWVKSRAFLFANDKIKAFKELVELPFVCMNCRWTGFGKELNGPRNHKDPNNWILFCPECDDREEVYPNVAGLAKGRIVQRWEAIGCPPLEGPWYHPFMKGSPLTDLEIFFKNKDLSILEIAYVAQQLFPSLLEMVFTVRDNKLCTKILNAAWKAKGV